MSQTTPAEEIRGKTINLKWTAGPTQGENHQHIFHEDGTVEWHSADPKPEDAPSATGDKAPERPEYAAVKVTETVYMISYLAPSSYTLTVVLNFADHTVVGFASGAEEWHRVEGTFEVVE